ncbi:MAG: CCA tRNA nucleotidyltransferase, partial [Planctomycetota bacterium]
MSMLTDAGFEAWFVGGCVRNALLGEPVSDLDISTSARPEQVMELAESAGLKAVPTGIE